MVRRSRVEHVENSQMVERSRSFGALAMTAGYLRPRHGVPVTVSVRRVTGSDVSGPFDRRRGAAVAFRRAPRPGRPGPHGRRRARP